VSLTAGQRLGPYEIVGALGAGGMGEVYRATDTHLKRSVAIKVLPAAMAVDADRLARFQREAEVLAALNHPNIAAIYGLERSDGVTALVMELVEGEDLSAVIAQAHSAPAAASPSGSASRGAAVSGNGAALPPETARVRVKSRAHEGSGTSRKGGAPRGLSIDDALRIARQIAEALEAAHEQGIIHRDLKPANIKIRSDGTVKVLDFGLAKAMDPPGLSSVEAMNSPTLTARATQMGMIIGTAAYMAPEQAKGKAVDKRADIWAFGVVLYEMLTGRRLFDAEDTSETLAAVLTRDISMTSLSSDIPLPLRAVLRDCLIRDPKQRLRDIGDARRVIDKMLAGAPDELVAPAAAAVAAAGWWKRALPWALAGLATAALLAVLVLWSPWAGAPATSPRRLLVSIGADASLFLTSGPSAILSPDGTTLAFAAQQDGNASRLFVRTLDQLQAVALPGTEGAINPFFSPDGQWIGFFSSGSLKKVSVKGGAALDVCAAGSGRGGTWTDDDTIFFSPHGSENATIVRVPAAGGTPVVFGELSDGAVTQRWPQALPNGAGVLYTESPSISAFDSANLVVRPLDGGAPKVVVRGASFGRYLPRQSGTLVRDGFLVYMQQGTLFGARFDLSRLEVVGQAVPVLQGVTTSPGSGGAQLAFSLDGLLAYVPGSAVTRAAPVDWTTRDGKTSALRATKAIWQNPMFSPDGQKLVMDIDDGKQRDIWVYDWARDTLTQLTFDPSSDWDPVWTPDGKRIVFTSDRAKRGVFNLYWVNADGTGQTTRLTDSPGSQFPTSWHPRGHFLTFFQPAAAGPSFRNDLMMLPMEGEPARGGTPGTPTVFLGTPAAESLAQFSPDGRWVAYASNEANGRFEVYVRPFPGPGGRWRVSSDGGSFPLWSRTAQELLFTDAGGQILFAPYTVVGESFRPDKPRAWTPTKLVGMGNAYPYAIHADGKRLALIAQSDQAGVKDDKVVLDFNFLEHLEKTVPHSK
jgi:serine/threonine-protein kinase